MLDIVFFYWRIIFGVNLEIKMMEVFMKFVFGLDFEGRINISRKFFE